MATQLKVYRCTEEEVFDPRDGDIPEPTVRVRLGDLLPLVAFAQKMKFIWLKDFLDDEVAVTPDLHDVLQNFRGCKPTAS